MNRILMTLLACMIASSLTASEYSQTEGNVAVHLVALEVGRNFLPNKEQPHIKPGTEYVVASYLVEYLGEEEIDHANSGSLTYWNDGKEIDISIPNEVGELCNTGISGRYNPKNLMCLYQDFDLSMIQNMNRTFLHRELWYGQLPDIPKVDIKIKAGFNDEIQEFTFTNVPTSRIKEARNK